ncbi:MAG TPA: hypothetical protein VMZ27_16905 [Candidatus Saccharimonadales bacterium]|nr:hypothetical protein [Candidatus Saccharimonadales bacterium]
MQILKRLLALLVVLCGWKSLQAQPVPANPASAPSTPATQPGVSAASTGDKTGKMTADQEEKARALLQAMKNVNTAPADAKPKVETPTDRDGELARIEAAVEEARKRREGKGETVPAPAVPVPTEAPKVVVTPSIVPATPAAPAVPAVVSAPVQVPAPEPATLSGEQETKARDLLNKLTVAAEPPKATVPVPAIVAPAPTISAPAAVVTATPAPPTSVVPPAVPAPAVVVTAPAPAAIITPAPAAVPASAPIVPGEPALVVEPAKLPPSNIPAVNAETERQRKIEGLLRAQVVFMQSQSGQAVTSQKPPPLSTKLPPGGVPVTGDASLPPTPLPAPIEPKGGEPGISTTAPVVQVAQSSSTKTAPKVVVAVEPTPATLTPDKEAQARELLERVSKEAPVKGRTSAAIPPSTPSPVTPPVAPAPAPAPVIPPPAVAAAPTASTLTPDKEAQARELLERIGKAAPAAPQTVTAPVPVVVPPASTAPVPVVVPTPNVVTTVAPANSVKAMSPEQEEKARNLLNQAAGRSTSPTLTAPTPAIVGNAPVPTITVPTRPVTPTTIPTPQAPVIVAPSVTTGTSVDREAKARELLNQIRNQQTAAPLSTPPVITPPAYVPAPVAPAATITTPPTVVVQTPTIAAPQPPATARMTPEQEAKALELLNQTALKTAAPATAAPAGSLEAYKDARRKAEADAKLRKKAEDQARKETERMQAENRARAKEDLRRKAEAEARAKKETEMTVSSVSAKERDDFRKRSEGAPAETVATTSVATSVPAPAPAPVTKESKKSANTASARPEEDPAFPASKRDQLTKLLRDYQQDKITPEEYHSGRAKIIGGQ